MNILRHIGVSYSNIYNAYKRIYDYLFNPYEGDVEELSKQFNEGKYILERTDQGKLRIFTIIVKVLADWINHIDSASATLLEKREFPIDKLQRELDKYESQLNQFPRENPQVRTIKDYLRRIRRKFSQWKILPV